MKKNVFLKAFAMLALMCAANTVAAQDAPDFWDVAANGDTLYYNIIADGEVSVSCTDDLYAADYDPSLLTGSIVIPSTVTHNGTVYTVTTIASFGFCSTNYTSIVIPNTVHTLEIGAFSGSLSLTSIDIPSSVLHIANYVFQNCPALASVTFNGYVNTIGDEIFGGDAALTSVVLPDSCGLVGNIPFVGCTGLTQPVYNHTHFMYMPQEFSGEYTIPDGIQSICGRVFEDHQGLTGIQFPSSVTSIFWKAFANCNGLTSVVLPPNLGAVSDATFANCANLQNVTITSNIGNIGVSAFSGCSSLTTVNLPETESPCSIKNSAFWGCSSLRSIVIPSSVDYFGYNVFEGATSLKRIVVKRSTPASLFDNSLHIAEFEDDTYTTVDTLVVPCGAAQAYRAADYWNEIPVIEEDCNSIDGIDGIAASDIIVRAEGNRIVVEGADGEPVHVFDVMGRAVRNGNLSAGVYVVKIGRHAARKIVVVR